ncbi:MAG TPA: hypothetical protein VJP39_00625 [Gaiellaceae bacterium]|nr:hypothetical protein [Gaiellaceae bacterium]
MARSLVLPLLLISLAVGGFLFVRDARTSGPTSTVAQQAETQAQVDVAATNFDGVVPVLQAWYAENATYAGATLPPGSGVVLVRADATSFCLQSGTEHLVGPGGVAQPGPC